MEIKSLLFFFCFFFCSEKDTEKWANCRRMGNGGLILRCCLREDYERMVEEVMLAVSLLLWQPDAICTQMTTSVFQYISDNVPMYHPMTSNVQSFAY